jgi:hypothetical protein
MSGKSLLGIGLPPELIDTFKIRVRKNRISIADGRGAVFTLEGAPDSA